MTINPPFKERDILQIKKGDIIYSLNPAHKKTVSKINRKVRVDHTIPGYKNVPGYDDQKAAIRWVGSSGYWYWIEWDEERMALNED